MLGGQLAAAITYFGFLSFFPLLALGFSLVGYISDIYPKAQDDVTRAVQDAFPSLVGDGDGQINIQDIIDARAGAGVIALLSAWPIALDGWLDALRDGLRKVFATSDQKIGFVRRSSSMSRCSCCSASASWAPSSSSSMATAATTFVLDLVGLDETPVAVGLLKCSPLPSPSRPTRFCSRSSSRGSPVRS